jgi:general secretion pathway protein A
VAAFVEASRAPRLAQVLADARGPGDEVSAFTAVFTRWGIDNPRGKAPGACRAARAEGLRCLLRTGRWKRLREYDLPAIIELTGPSSMRHFAAVLAVDDRTATLDVGGRRVVAPLTEVEPVWNGDFIVVWRPPAVTTVPLTPGVRARDVDWLRRRLAAIDGGSVTATVPDLYDRELRERVVTFQKSRALGADGVVGEETLIHLMLAVPEPGMPRLSAGSS